VAALERITLKVGAPTAPHIALQLVDRRRLSPAHDVERGVAAQAFDFEVQVAGIERVAQRRGGLGRPLEGHHVLIPRLTGELIGLPACLYRPFLGRAYRCAVDALS